MRLLLIDNYDSFTWNLVHLFAALGARAEVVRNDARTLADLLGSDCDAVVLSPGPCGPAQAGVCVPLVRALAGRRPVLGVCLGHQAIAEAYGARVARAPVPVHGKVSAVQHEGRGVLRGAPVPVSVARYHSLAVEPGSLAGTGLVATAWSEDGVIMVMEHAHHPVHGVQFHPESIATEAGAAVAGEFLTIARAFAARRPGETGPALRPAAA